MKIFVYPHTDGAAWFIRALSDQGERVLEVPRSTKPTMASDVTPDVRDAINNYFDRPVSIVWVWEPAQHPQLAQLIALISEEDEPKVDDPRVDVCSSCSHATVCAAFQATSAIGAVIATCPKFSESQHE